jgi:hypothetical protein
MTPYLLILVIAVAIFLASYNLEMSLFEIARNSYTALRKFLLNIGLLVETKSKEEAPVSIKKIRVALIAFVLGLLLTIQIDWLLSQVIVLSAQPTDIVSVNRTSFNSPQFDRQLALYKQRLATKKPPQVLIVGSSRALRGIDPVALSQGLASQGYRNRDVFNLSVNGATAQVVDFLIRQVLKPKELPQLIIWGDGVRAFNSGREDLTFNTIAASKGYKQLLQKTLSNRFLSYRSLNEWLNEQLGRVSFSYEQRDRLKEKLQQLGRPAIAKETQEVVDSNGFLPLSIRFNPSTYYQKHPKISGNNDRDYKAFDLGSKQNTALQAILKFTEAKKIPIVFVNLPLTAEYLDPVRTKYEKQFQQYMLGLKRPYFIYRDLTQLFPQANNNFSDPSHLNRYGAYQVSKKLAVDKLIPFH